MNERVCELMKEAGYAAPELAGRARRLTELIVLECCKEIKEAPFYAGTASDWLKQHFGVE